MIKLKFNTLDSKDGEILFPSQNGKSLLWISNEILKPVDLKGRKPDEVFSILLNGEFVDPKLWEETLVFERDDVLLVPNLMGGDSGQIFKQFAILAITLATAVYFPASASLWNVGIIAGANIAATIALNQLIPPPVLEKENLGGSGSLEASQMYAIGGQSNQVRRLQTVPKVYGTHRIFPAVAANPYTEIETDPSTGELAQYLYAVYDFGLGPMYVGDLKIGETPITDFKDVLFRFVDFNRPPTNEGTWDVGVSNSLLYYKGDNSAENLALVLDGNQNESDPLETYQVQRTTSDNPSSLPSTITLTFFNPRGLYSYSSTGQLGSRKIKLEIHFRKEGTTDWLPYNEYAHVLDHKAAGGSEEFQDFNYNILPYSLANESSGYWAFLGFTPNSPVYHNDGGTEVWKYERRIGLKAGVSNSIVYLDPGKLFGSAKPGDKLHYGSRYIGTISTITSIVGDYKRLTFTAPVSEDFEFFQVYQEGALTSVPPQFWPKEVGVANKLVRKFPVLASAIIERSSTTPVYSTFQFTPIETGKFQVRVTRLETTTQYTNQYQDSLAWSQISTRLDSSPIQTTKRHTFLEIKIRATNQLNGVINNLSGVATSALEVWNGTSWTRQLTQNPAWVFTDLLIGDVNKNKIPKSRLHLPSILEWANFCDQIPASPPSYTFIYPRFRCNFVLDYDTSLQGLLEQVGSAGQASLNIIDGKYGILIDKLRTVPVQVFTPRNSSNFGSSRIYSAKPHGLRVKYIDPTIDFELSEAVVYDSGYNSGNATEFQEITSFACTSYEQAWRFGKYILAQNRLRQETMTLTVDFEHLVCTRGDYVRIAQDVMKVGGTAARVLTVSGNQITIDESLETGPYSYGFMFRSSANGQIVNGTLTVVNAYTFDLAGGSYPSKGDLIVIGVVSQIYYDCLVKSIQTNEDLTATLTLIEKADGVYSAESSDLIEEYDPRLNETINGEFFPPNEVLDLEVLENSYRCNGNGYDYYIKLDWDAPIGSAYETFRIYSDYGKGFLEVGESRISEFEYLVDQNYLGVEHKFKVLAVSSTGKKLPLGEVGEVSAIPLFKTALPGDVETFNTDITGEVLQLSWVAVNQCDIFEYLIRYNPTLNGTWNNSIPLLRVDRRTTTSSTQARIGTYLIKAVDFNGNESANAAVAITTIPNLFNLNVIEEITDFPALTGSKNNVEKIGNELYLAKSVVGDVLSTEYYPSGYYYYNDVLDLGDIYTVRLQSLIQADGYTGLDLMSNWTTLASVPLLANTGSSEWDVETEYRTSDDFNSMAAWPTLSSVSLLAAGDESDFTAWKKFTIGDATGRIFQFRLKLVSNQTSVTPRVFDGTIRVDMPDRIERFENLSAPDTGLQVNYSPHFYGPTPSPTIQISLQSGQSGDYWVFNSKNLEGFNITFYDKNNVAVARTFDVAILGYGRKYTTAI